MKTILAGMIISLFALATGDDIVGKWETTPSPTGNAFGVNFKTDGSFEMYQNRKPFGSGHYTFSKDTFRFTDNGCDGKPGVYKINFFSNKDSLRFEAISDSCVQRREG